VSVKITFVASKAPVFVSTTVYMIVSPGLTATLVLSVLVAVTVVPGGLNIPARLSLSLNASLRSLGFAPVDGVRSLLAPGEAGRTTAFPFPFNPLEMSLDPDTGLSPDAKNAMDAMAHIASVT